MKTLALFYPGCIEFEIMLACEMLNATFPVDIATPDGSDHVGSNGMTFKAATSLESVQPNEYRVALVPGGDPGSVIGNRRLNEVLQQCYANSAILGAICAGPVILEQAGLLRGRRIAHGYKGSQLDFLIKSGFFKNTTLTDENVIVDRPIITARPDSFIDFAVEVAHLAGVISKEKVEFWKNYYRGRG